ncbi:MAG TPA: flagellar export chaperone FliS [Bryobacteraceae bacterium]|nr:flagellar export chaperone FliS [Bryobacteraceae bacterium]
MNRQKEYLLNRVTSASPVELVCILYETAIQATDEALAALRSGEILKRGEAVNKACQILCELQISLRHDIQEDYSDNLDGLYSYMQRQLVKAHAEKSEECFDEVSRLLHTLLDGWQGALKNLDASAAPETPQTQPAVLNASYAGQLAGDPTARSWHL